MASCQNPLPPAPLPLPLTHLPSLAAPVGRPTAALLPSTLPRERQWAIPRLRSTFPPLLRRLWAIPRLQSTPPLPMQRLWAIPRLHAFPLSSPAVPVGDPTAALPPSPPQPAPLHRQPSGRAVNSMSC